MEGKLKGDLPEYRSESEYKLTQFGKIPSDWKIAKFKDIVIGKGSYGIGAAAVDYSEDFPRYLRITDISDTGNLINTDPKSVNDPDWKKYVLKRNDIVFARTGNTTGKTYLYSEKDGELVYAGFLIKYSINPKVADSKFVKYFTESNFYWQWVKIMSMRSGQPGINENDYGKLSIPLPKLEEQKKIASILVEWDKAIDLKEDLIQQKNERKKGIMQKLLAGEVRLPGFYGDWEIVTLEKVASVTMGQSPPSSSYNELQKGLPLIQGNADCNNRKTAPKIWTCQPTKTCQVGDIIMTVRAPVGNVSRSIHEACIGRGVCAIRSNINQDFLYYQLISKEHMWVRISQGSTFESINSNDIKALQIRMPSDKEQKAIAEILVSSDKEIDLHERELYQLKQQKKGLMQLLLTGKVRV